MADEFQSSRPCEHPNCQNGQIALDMSDDEWQLELLYEVLLEQEYERIQTIKPS